MSFESSSRPLEREVPIEGSKTVSSFEHQWKQPEKITFPDDTIEMYDIRPEYEKTDIPAALMPGWGGTPEMYRENMRTLAAKNRRALSVNAPHGITVDKGQFIAADIDKIPDAVLRRIAALINSLDVKQIQKTDAIGHSQGCLDIVLAATLYPERFRNVVLVTPAGMIGKDTFWRLATSFSIDVVKGYVQGITQSIAKESDSRTGRKVIFEPMLRALREVAGSALKDPVRAFREVLAISDAEIHELLIGLREKGIGISVVSAADDEVFPSGRMQKIITRDMVDGFYSVAGRHDQFQSEAETYTGVAESALTALEKKQENANTIEA